MLELNLLFFLSQYRHERLEESMRDEGLSEEQVNSIRLLCFRSIAKIFIGGLNC